MTNLGTLRTSLGDRSLYDAVSQCSRCGYCEQSCPTYLATGDEAKSPRGRNQLLRLVLEKRLAPEAASESLATCLLCGGCQTTCYAHVSVPDLMLEGRRLIRERPHWLVTAAVGLMLRRPALFDLLLKAANLAKRLGLSALARPALRLAGLAGLAEADRHVGRAPLRFLKDDLRLMPEPTAPSWRYFAACGPNYLYPEVGRATIAALWRARGEGAWLKTGCCGLLAYNYGEVDDARAMARKVIEDAEASGGPVVADCSSCSAFMKSYPQLFLSEPGWLARAEAFAARVQDAPEALAAEADKLPAGSTAETLTYHDSCRACHGQGIRQEPRTVLKKVAGSSFTELPESEECCGGAGAFSFLHPELSEEVLKRKIARIAKTGARVVATSSTSCLLQLARGLAKYYPECRVVHLSELAAASLDASDHGPTPRA